MPRPSGGGLARPATAVALDELGELGTRRRRPTVRRQRGPSSSCSRCRSPSACADLEFVDPHGAAGAGARRFAPDDCDAASRSTCGRTRRRLDRTHDLAAAVPSHGPPTRGRRLPGALGRHVLHDAAGRVPRLGLRVRRDCPSPRELPRGFVERGSSRPRHRDDLAALAKHLASEQSSSARTSHGSKAHAAGLAARDSSQKKEHGRHLRVRGLEDRVDAPRRPPGRLDQGVAVLVPGFLVFLA
mmetsp:Transcript_17599/g.70679  ORF Transcript_17599/g.70679 Transcript_17599/m.70679 type:complete len:243 (+) Transcript_17599:425-1153(+)